MKITKSLIATMALLAMGSSAQATETIYITGSTSYRAATITAIVYMLGGSINSLTTNSTPTCQSDDYLTHSNAVNWIGKTYNGYTVNIKISMYGSVGGVQTVSNSLAWPFLKDSASGTVTFDPTNSSDVSSLGDSHVPEITLSDTFQSSTPFTTNILTHDTLVGVIPFQWVASYGAPTGQSLNNHLVNAIFSLGSAALATMTGSTTDRTTLGDVNIDGSVVHNMPKQLFAIGRDADSGARLNALAESGYGVSTAVYQYQPTLSGNSIASQVGSPPATINGISYDEGNTGYNSGGTLANLMRYESLTNLGGYYVTYLGKGDASTALVTTGSSVGAGNAVALAWNGANYWNGSTFDDSVVTEGKYTFWSYEHVMYGTLSNYADSFARDLAGTIRGTSANTGTGLSSGISYYSMQVSRAGDGNYVTQNY